MERRRFLSVLAGGFTAAMTLDPERLLWVPGSKLISIPNTIRVATPDEILMDWNTVNTMVFQILYAPSEVDRTMSPFWKNHYLHREHL